jgi:hypothetical protein
MINNFEQTPYGEFPEGIQSVIQASHMNKAVQTRTWDLSLLYLQGKQNIRYDKSLQQFLALRSNPGRNKLIINQILNIYRAVVSRLSMNYPSVSCLPASNSEEDIQKARASEQVLKYNFHADKQKDKLEKAIEWLVSCGNVALQEFYDPADKKVHLKVVSPYDLFFEAGAVSFEDSSFVACRSLVRTDDLVKAYPNKADDIRAQSTTSKPTDPASLNTGAVGVYDTNDPYIYNRTEIYDVYWKDGKYAVVCGNLYLYKGQFASYPCFPVQHITYAKVPDKLWGMGMIESIIDLQNQYNKTRNLMLENVELMSNPKWLIPKTAGVNAQSIRGTPGEIIFYNAAGGAPTQVSGSPIPSYVMDHLTRVQTEMMDVSGIHSTTLGRRVVGITSGKAIDALAQQDVSQLTQTQESMERAVRDMFEASLMLMKKYYTEPQMVRMFDDKGGFIYNSIQATDIIEEPEVWIEAGSLFRDETADRDQKIMDLMQAGLIDKDTAIRELSFKTGGGYIMDQIANRNHALEMLEGVKQGADVEIFATDDLATFLDVFGKFMRTRDFYMLPTQTQDYIRDIYVAIGAYQPLPPGTSAAEQKAAMKVFPKAPALNNPQQLTADMITASPQAQQQQATDILENSQVAGGAQQIMRKASTLQNFGQQPKDEAVINKRGLV